MFVSEPKPPPPPPPRNPPPGGARPPGGGMPRRKPPAGGVNPRGGVPPNPGSRPPRPPRPPKPPPNPPLLDPSPEMKLGPAPGKTPLTACLDVVADQAAGAARNPAVARATDPAATPARVRPL